MEPSSLFCDTKAYIALRRMNPLTPICGPMGIPGLTGIPIPIGGLLIMGDVAPIAAWAGIMVEGAAAGDDMRLGAVCIGCMGLDLGDVDPNISKRSLVAEAVLEAAGVPVLGDVGELAEFI